MGLYSLDLCSYWPCNIFRWLFMDMFQADGMFRDGQNFDRACMWCVTGRVGWGDILKTVHLSSVTAES